MCCMVFRGRRRVQSACGLVKLSNLWRNRRKVSVGRPCSPPPLTAPTPNLRLLTPSHIALCTRGRSPVYSEGFTPPAVSCPVGYMPFGHAGALTRPVVAGRAAGARSVTVAHQTILGTIYARMPLVMLIACASEAIPADFHAQPRHDVAFHNFEDAVALSAAADTLSKTRHARAKRSCVSVPTSKE